MGWRSHTAGTCTTHGPNTWGWAYPTSCGLYPHSTTNSRYLPFNSLCLIMSERYSLLYSTISLKYMINISSCSSYNFVMNHLFIQMYVFCSISTEKFFDNFFEDSLLSMICTQSHWMFLFPPQLCDTYPKHLFVPASASTPIILGSSKFRSRGRLPVLSYFHSKTQVSSRYRLVVYI